MRKVLSVLMASCIALLSSSTAVLAAENDNYEVIKSIADTAAENYLTFSAGNPELDNWDYLEIDQSYPIYDFNDNIEGFVYELTGTNKQGFILVSNHNEQMKVTRASAYNSFEYIDELEDGETLYGVNTRTFYTKDNDEFTDLETGNSVSVNNYESKNLSLVSPRSSIAQVGGNTYYFIDNYNSIPNIVQEGNDTCVATSAAMLLRYYYNTGETAVMIDQTTAGGLAIELAKSQYIGSSQVSPYEYEEGITSWLTRAGYTNIDVDYYIGDSPSNPSQPNYDTLEDNEIYSLLDEIQSDRPVIVMVGERAHGNQQVGDVPATGNYDTEYLGASEHAMVTYGVKQYGETYYLISKDPWRGVDPNPDGSRVQESIWYTEDDHSTYFAIYAVIYTSFS